MTQKLKRPEKFVPLSVRFATGKTGTKLLEKFGLDGLAVWASFLAACKVNDLQGEIEYASEEEGWSRLGLAKYRPDFTLEAFFRVTGQLKQTRKTCSGRVNYVIATHWDEWNDVTKTESERERKARYRWKKKWDSPTDESQDSPEGVPDVSPLARGERERERESSSSSSSKGRAVARPPSAYSLPFSQERIVLQILEAVGADSDNGTPDVIRRYAVHLPEGSLAKVLESVASSRKRNKAEYAVGALKSECAERGIAV